MHFGAGLNLKYSFFTDLATNRSFVQIQGGLALNWLKTLCTGLRWLYFWTQFSFSLYPTFVYVGLRISKHFFKIQQSSMNFLIIFKFRNTCRI